MPNNLSLFKRQCFYFGSIFRSPKQLSPTENESTNEDTLDEDSSISSSVKPQVIVVAPASSKTQLFALMFVWSLSCYNVVLKTCILYFIYKNKCKNQVVYYNICGMQIEQGLHKHLQFFKYADVYRVSAQEKNIIFCSLMNKNAPKNIFK